LEIKSQSEPESGHETEIESNNIFESWYESGYESESESES
jgi:hypothetical protein